MVGGREISVMSGWEFHVSDECPIASISVFIEASELYPFELEVEQQ